jgi:hypothetical protein
MVIRSLTAFGVFLHGLLNLTLIRDLNILSTQSAAIGAEATIRIHSFLKGIVLPAKDIVAVLAISSVVSGA